MFLVNRVINLAHDLDCSLGYQFYCPSQPIENLEEGTAAEDRRSTSTVAKLDEFPVHSKHRLLTLPTLCSLYSLFFSVSMCLRSFVYCVAVSVVVGN